MTALQNVLLFPLFTSRSVSGGSHTLNTERKERRAFCLSTSVRVDAITPVIISYLSTSSRDILRFSGQYVKSMAAKVISFVVFFKNFFYFKVFSYIEGAFVFKRFYLFIFRETEREGEREGEKHGCVRETLISYLPHTPNWEPGLEPRHVPWLGTELVTFWFAGWCSIHWATLARARRTFLISCTFLKSSYQCFAPLSVGKRLTWTYAVGTVVVLG